METIIKLLIEKHLTLSLSESMTGGLVSSKLVEISGSSKVFKGSLISYQDIIKTDVLKVDSNTIKTFGVVSKEVATMMANQTQNLFDSDISLSITGYAEAPCFAYIAIKTDRTQEVYEIHYPDLSRIEAISYVTKEALQLLEKMLLSL